MIESLEKFSNSSHLSLWADVFGVIGAFIAALSFILNLRIKRKLTQLKSTYLLDRRIIQHIKRLKEIGTNISNLLNGFTVGAIVELRTQLSICDSELEDIQSKLARGQRRKIRRLLRKIVKINRTPFRNEHMLQSFWVRIFQNNPTTKGDVWTVYQGLQGVISQLDNLKQNMIKQ